MSLKIEWINIIEPFKVGKMNGKIPALKEAYNNFNIGEIEDTQGCGLKIVEPLVGIDIDNVQHAKLLLKIIKYLNLKCLVYKSKTRGMHFIFKTNKKYLKSHKSKCYFGFPIEFYPWGKTKYFVIKDDKKWREILIPTRLVDLDLLPEWLITGDGRFENLVGLEEGEFRNDLLMSIFGKMKHDKNISTWSSFVNFVTVVNHVLFAKPIDANELSQTILRYENQEEFAKTKKNLLKKDAKLTPEEIVDRFIHNNKLLKYNSVLHIFEDDIYTPNTDLIKRRLLLENRNVSNRVREGLFKDVELLVKEETIDNLNTNMLAFKNGILDWSNPKHFKLLKFSPDYKILRKINVNLDPDYLHGKKEHPLYKKIIGFLTSNNQELEAYLLYLTANALIWSENKLQYCTILYGDGENGKSVFINLLECFFGKWNVTNLSLKEFSDKFSTIQLVHSMINTRNETDPMAWGNEKSFKEIVSGDSIKAEAKFSKIIFFRPTTKIFISANKLYQSKDKSKGFERRIAIIPCTNRFDGKKWKKDLRLNSEEYINNAYGLKETLLAKLIPYLQKILLNITVEPPKIVKRMVDKHVHGESSLLLFLLDKINYTLEEFFDLPEINRASVLPKFTKEKVKDWMLNYRLFCDDIDKKPYGESRVVSELEKLYNIKIIKRRLRSNNERFYFWIRSE